jgi:hypothetical protein
MARAVLWLVVVEAALLSEGVFLLGGGVIEGVDVAAHFIAEC